MKKRILFTILAIVMVACLLPSTAFAASASVKMSKSTIEVGSTVKATFTFKATNIGAVEATFSYDASVLQYVSGSGTSGGGGNGKIALVTDAEGKSSLSASVTFKALKPGKAKVSVSASTILGYDESNQGGASGSASVTVVAKGTLPTATPKPSSSAPASASPSPTPSFNPATQAFQAAVGEKTLYLWNDLTSVTLPEGFTAAKATYQEHEIGTAQNTSLTLVYATDDKGTNGAFYVLDQTAGSLSPYIQITAGESYTILHPAATATVPEGYTETTLVLKDQSIQAWVLSSEEKPEFYLIYAVNSKGASGFYTYDTVEGTIQRYTDRNVTVEQQPEVQPVEQVAPQPTPTGFFEKLQANPGLMAIVIVLAVLDITAVVVIIILSVKIKKKKPSTHYRDVL